MAQLSTSGFVRVAFTSCHESKLYGSWIAFYMESLYYGTINEARVFLPLSLTCHHATTDGYHIRTFLEALQDGMDGFEQFL